MRVPIFQPHPRSGFLKQKYPLASSIFTKFSPTKTNHFGVYYRYRSSIIDHIKIVSRHILKIILQYYTILLPPWLWNPSRSHAAWKAAPCINVWQWKRRGREYTQDRFLRWQLGHGMGQKWRLGAQMVLDSSKKIVPSGKHKAIENGHFVRWFIH